jgi:putative ABC transport system substrate-binding protein
MRRRAFLAAAAVAGFAPAIARSPPSTVPIVGYLALTSPGPFAPLRAAFHKGLAEAGFVEGRNVAIEYRWAHNEPDRLRDLAIDLVRREVAVIAIGDNTPAALAAKAATTSIPIVFITGIDPVQSGLVPSLNRPGGNVTGISHMNAGLAAKRLGLLRELLPQASRITALVTGSTMQIGTLASDLQEAASLLKVEIEMIETHTPRDIDAAFVTMAQKQTDALVVSPGLANRRVQVVTLAMYHRVPAIFAWREDVVAGGLMTYGPSLADQFRQAGLYTGRILKGEKPADLPVMRATKFEFVINLQTARTLGITVPPGLLATADEVIE